MKALLQEIKTQKKMRSDAVARLRACAAEAKKITGPYEEPTAASPAPKNGEVVPEINNHKVRRKKARTDRQKALATLKRTTTEAVQNIRKTVVYGSEKLRQALEEAPSETNGRHPKGAIEPKP